MMLPLTIRPCGLKIWQGTFSMVEALDFAATDISSSEGWILAEMPERVIWRQWRAGLNPAELAHCTTLYCFDQGTELRLYKHDSTYLARRIWLDEEGEKGFERLSSYSLRDGQGRLLYAEFFQPSYRSGMLELRHSRFCGVSGIQA